MRYYKLKNGVYKGGIDLLDKQILEALKLGYLSPKIKGISNLINVSPSVVQYRINRLKRNGVLLGYKPIVNLSKIQSVVNGVVILSVKGGITKKLLNYLESLKQIDEVKLVMGKNSLYIRITCSSIQEFYKILEQLQDKNKNIEIITSELLMDTSQLF